MPHPQTLLHSLPHAITLVPMSSLPHTCLCTFTPSHWFPCPHTLTPSHWFPCPHSLTCPHTLTPSNLSPHLHSLTLNCPSTLTPSHLSLHPPPSYLHIFHSPTPSLPPTLIPYPHISTPKHLTSTPSLPPPLFPLPDGLLKMLYMVLLHQQMRHPGAPKSSSSALTPTPSSSSFLETDIGSITLALQTLGSFNFGG